MQYTCILVQLVFKISNTDLLMVSPEIRDSKPQGYKSFFMLNSTEHEISTAHKNYKKKRQIKKLLALSLSDVVFIMLINGKMPTIVGILTFMSRINFVLSCVEHKKVL